MGVKFTKHAEDKFFVLKRHGIIVSRQKVLDTVKKPDYIEHGRLPLLIAQSSLDSQKVLRVVYKEEFGKTIIITFYPGRKLQYEKRGAKNKI